MSNIFSLRFRLVVRLIELEVRSFVEAKDSLTVAMAPDPQSRKAWPSWRERGEPRLERAAVAYADVEASKPLGNWELAHPLLGAESCSRVAC